MAILERDTELLQSETYLPDEESKEFLKFAQVLNGIDVSSGDSSKAMLVGPEGSRIEIPAELFSVLGKAANVLANGDGVTILRYSAMLTTQDAADFLGMSRPTFVKILESGAIPFEKVGRHRRVTLRNVVEFQERTRSERRSALKDLAKDSIEDFDKLPKGAPTLRRLNTLRT